MRKRYLLHIKLCACTTLVIASAFMPSSAFAYNNNHFYSSNDILFYDESDSGFTGGGCYNSEAPETYSESSKQNQEIVAKFFASTNFAGNGNKPLNAVQMAAILGNIQAESGFDPESVSSDSSHRGIVQWSASRWADIAEPKTDLNNQLNFIKTELNGSYKNSLGNFWELSDSSEIDEAAYLIARNYEVAISNGGGSTGWTNDSDATANIQNWEDRRDFARNLYGTYGSLAGSAADCVGMDESAAESFMDAYENSDGNSLYQKYSCDGYDSSEQDAASKNILANCVAVVVYFIQNYTTEEHISLPNGGQVVGELIKHGWTDGGSTPKPYAVFSTDRYGGEAGHTGIVLGVDGNSVIIFEEGCGNKLHKDGDDWAGINTYSMSEINSSYKFAYPPEGSLKGLQ